MTVDGIKLCDIPKFSGYAVSRGGQVWSKLTRKWLRPGQTDRGYLLVVLRQAEKKKSRYIHRLVLETYVGPCPPGKEACHNNGNKTDNRLENLRWATRSENEADKKRHNVAVLGEQHPKARLTEKDVKKIRRMYARQEATQKELGKIFGVSAPQISRICSGRDWAHLRR